MTAALDRPVSRAGRIGLLAGALAAGLGAAVWVGRAPGEAPEGAHLARELAEVPVLLGLVEPLQNPR